MNKTKLYFTIPLMILLVAISVLSACASESSTPATSPGTSSSPAPQPVTLYVGGTMALTGAYAEDTAAVLAAYEDYVKYINETKNLAPWRTEKFPDNVNLEVLWRDDELNPEKALTIYDELKGKGMLVYRCSGSPQALALKDLLNEDSMGAPSMATGPYLLTPPQTVFTYYPIYTDTLAAIADWFMENWKETGKPRVAYLTADNAMGKSIDIPEMQAYLENAGYEFVGSQFVPLVPTSPPTTQLAWLKENNVNLAIGVMINPGSQPTIKEAVRLGMGPNLDYKITFGFAAPSHLAVFLPAMGALGEGVVVGGSFPPLNDMATPGIKFADDLQAKYRPNDRVTHIMYVGGMLEVMMQTEALRLAMLQTPADQLTRSDVLNNGFFKIKNMGTGELSATPITLGPGDIEGVDEVRIDQIQNEKIVKVGSYPLRHIYTK
jgi:hypothetical protein